VFGQPRLARAYSGHVTSWDVRLLARYALPGFVGSLILAVGALGVGWLPLEGGFVDAGALEPLRGTTFGQLLSRAFVFVGVALLLQAWLILGHDLLAGPDDPHSLRNTPPATLVTVLVAWVAPLVLAPPLFSRDVYSYFAQGRVVDSGQDPYETGVAVVDGWFENGADPMWAETPTPYGPVWLLFARGVANFAPDQPALGAIAFRLAALAGLALLVIYVPRLAFAHGIDASAAMWIGVLNPLVIMHVVSGAHNDALMIGLIVMGFALATQKHPALGAIAVSAAAAVKPIALLALPFIGLMWAGLRAGWVPRIRAWVLALLLCIAVFTAASLLAGVGPGWIGALGTPGEVRTWLSPATAIGMLLGMLTTAAGITIDDALVVTVTRLVGTIAALAIVAWLILRPEGRSPVRGAALAFLTVIILGPVIQPWYLLWILPLFAVTGLSPVQLRVTILVIAGFSLHGMAESSSTSDNLFEFSDGLAIVAAFVIVGLVLLVSPRERRLVLGGPLAHGLLPAAPEEQARAAESVFRGRIAPRE
jgi:alpha-1,6-mannosyltransferase